MIDMPSEQCLGLGSAVGLDDTDHDVEASLLARGAFGQHFVGLADTGRGAEEDLQTAAALLRGFTQKGLGRRAVTLVGWRHLTDFALDASSCRLRARTLT